jgi:hypothetical protein
VNPRTSSYPPYHRLRQNLSKNYIFVAKDECLLETYSIILILNNVKKQGIINYYGSIRAAREGSLQEYE